MGSDLGLHCLTMPHKKDARLIWVNNHQNDECVSKDIDQPRFGFAMAQR